MGIKDKLRDKDALRFEILKISQLNESLQKKCESMVSLIKKWLGSDVVALRLKEGDDFPYFVNNGFPGDFIKSESCLIARDEKGNMLKDENGEPVLACMCGNIIRARFNPIKPFFSKGGSFWSNCTTDLLASTNEKDRMANTRNTCNSYGYESVALVPIKTTSDNIGLFQINDKRQNLFTPEVIEFLEEIGSISGVVIEAERAKEALRRSHEDLERKVRERTAALSASEKKLKERVKELETFHDMAVERELKMEELRNKVKELEAKLRGKNA